MIFCSNIRMAMLFGRVTEQSLGYMMKQTDKQSLRVYYPRADKISALFHAENNHMASTCRIFAENPCILAKNALR